MKASCPAYRRSSACGTTPAVQRRLIYIGRRDSRPTGSRPDWSAPTTEDVKAFLTRLAMVDKVSASTQNQAFSALLLLFREVLRTDMKKMARKRTGEILAQKVFMCPVSMLQALKDEAEKENKSESEIIREVLRKRLR